MYAWRTLLFHAFGDCGMLEETPFPTHTGALERHQGLCSGVWLDAGA